MIKVHDEINFFNIVRVRVDFFFYSFFFYMSVYPDLNDRILTETVSNRLHSRQIRGKGGSVLKCRQHNRKQAMEALLELTGLSFES